MDILHTTRMVLNPSGQLSEKMGQLETLTGLHLSLVMRKLAFCICKNKDADQITQLISAFVFAIRIVQSLYFLNPKFQDSSHLLCLCSPVCVGPGRKPRRPVFSQRGSFYLCVLRVRTASKLTTTTSNKKNHNESTTLEQRLVLRAQPRPQFR